jgi:hypothetical protein
LVGLLLVALAFALGALWRSRRMGQQLQALEMDLRRAETLGHEQAERLAALEALRDTQQLTEHAIATGTAVVKEVHKGIADIPFSVFEAIPATREPAKALRGLHDSISDGIYGAISGLNKAVGRELRKGVPLAEASTPEVAEPHKTAENLDSTAPVPNKDESRWG